jgi:hypothetical protein
LDGWDSCRTATGSRETGIETRAEEQMEVMTPLTIRGVEWGASLESEECAAGACDRIFCSDRRWFVDRLLRGAWEEEGGVQFMRCVRLLKRGRRRTRAAEKA